MSGNSRHSDGPCILGTEKQCYFLCEVPELNASFDFSSCSSLVLRFIHFPFFINIAGIKTRAAVSQGFDDFVTSSNHSFL